MNEHLTVAIDSDGVLAHFEGLVCKYNRVSQLSQISRGRLWQSVGEYDRLVGPFFEHLDKMPDADQLMDFVRANFVNHFILTARGHVPKNGEQQKKNWYRKNYGPELVVKVVVSSGDKAQFANPNTILIDDRTKSITPWEAAGGIGILHTDAASTITRLKELIAERANG